MAVGFVRSQIKSTIVRGPEGKTILTIFCAQQGVIVNLPKKKTAVFRP